ncbi:MAG: carboxymethylenebutenolidase [Sphingomonadales bacterium]|jgi:carboxymethylenebutenolidase|nr:carboxymethylenebutenolidase [Sphingomonadales bacterium]
MIEQVIDIPTRDGICDTFVVHPESGGPHPAVLMYQDGGGVREELRDMARRLASTGYYVLLPNLFYHSGVSDLGPIDLDTSSEWFQNVLRYSHALNTELVMSDTAAMLAFIDSQEAARKGAIGCFGYCMTGGYAVSAAARFADRIAATAAFCGTSMVTEDADSPHRTLGQIKGELYIGWAELDPYIPRETLETFDAALAESAARAEVEIYPAARHAFMFPTRYSYEKPHAERHWEQLHALFRRTLG